MDEVDAAVLPRAHTYLAAIDAGWTRARRHAEIARHRRDHRDRRRSSADPVPAGADPGRAMEPFPDVIRRGRAQSAHERHRGHRPGLGPRVMGLATERCRLREAPAAVAQSASGRLRRMSGPRCWRTNPSCAAMSTRRLPSLTSDGTIQSHSGRQQISRDCREMTLDSRSRRMRIDR